LMSLVSLAATGTWEGFDAVQVLWGSAVAPLVARAAPVPIAAMVPAVASTTATLVAVNTVRILVFTRNI
jgi:hypothetical protein